jgi:transcriptional regulator NrdR family protein
MVRCDVRKKNGDRQNYDRSRLRRSLVQAAGSGKHRQIRDHQIDELLRDIEAQIWRQLQTSTDNTVSSTEIGLIVLEELRRADYGAFWRYLSVFSSEIFKDDNLRELGDEIVRRVRESSQGNRREQSR